MSTPDPSERPNADVSSGISAAPTVTVITCAYNVAAYIRESVLSALQQTYTDLEVIVIDDGSSDGTLERLQDISDTRLRLFKKPHQGQAASINEGLAHARGDYIALLDGDDMWLPEKLERHVALHTAHPHVDMTYSGSREIDAKGNVAGLLPATDRSVSFRELLVENPVHNGSVSVIRREALLEAGPFDISLRSCHDLDMWFRIARLRENNIVGLSELLTLYRRRPNQTSSDARRMEQGWSQVIAKMALVAPDEVGRTEAARRVNWNRYFAYISYQTRRFGSSLRYLGRGILSSPTRFLADRRNILLTGACLSGLLLPARWHQALYLHMRGRYDRAAMARVRWVNQPRRHGE